MSSRLVIFINGKQVSTAGCDPSDSLVSFIRDTCGLKGTKSNCDYGSTGADTVVMSSWNRGLAKFTHRTISACSTPLASAHRTNITTVEGIGSTSSPHLLQTRLAACHAVQCGYDSPGTVLSTYGLLLNNTQPSMQQLESSQVGNISRCSGYRAVIEAFKVFTEMRNDEAVKLEATLPDELKMEDSEPAVFKGTVTWHKVPSHFWVKALQKKEKNCLLVYGIPQPETVLSYDTIIDISGIERTSQGITMSRTGMDIGATVTIEELINFLTKNLKQQHSYLMAELVGILQSIKTPQYRAMTAIGDAVQSCLEIRLLLLAVNAKLVASSGPNCKNSKFEGVEKTVLFEEVSNTVEELNLRSVFIPKAAENCYLIYYKVAARKANAFGNGNAFFNVELKENLIEKLNIFVGKKCKSEQKMKTVMDELIGKNFNDINFNNLTNNVSEGLFRNIVFKFLSNLKDIGIGNKNSLGKIQDERYPNRPFLKSTQYVSCVDGYNESDPTLGKSVPHVAGLSCACGQAVFGEDIPKIQDELFLALVCSSKAHAKLLDIDPSGALDMPGVVQFLSVKDVPAGRNKYKTLGMEEELIFADGEVVYEGQPIAAIAATSEKLARKAAACVKVTYEELKPIVSLDEAIAAKNFIQTDSIKSFTIGNAESALENSNDVVEGMIQTTRQEHFYEERNNCLVIPIGEDDEYKVYIGTPAVILIQHAIAATLGISFSRVHIHSKRVGCSFGGKISRFVGVANATALAAKLTGKPVRCVLTRDEDIRITGQRGEFRGYYKVGITDGKIMGAQIQLYKNAGWNAGSSPDITTTTMIHLDASYEFPTFDVAGESCITNTASNTAFRAYGAPPAMTITENMLYDACVELGLDPVEFRKANLQQPGYETHFGQIVEESDVTMGACMDEVIKRCNYYELKNQVEEFNQNNRWKKRGVYLIPNKYGVGMPSAIAQNGALVHIYVDGSVLISHGGVECGQGLHTKMLQIVAHELGIPIDKIRVSESANDKVPNPIPTGGSSAADLNGNALRDACAQINDRLVPLREGFPKATWEMIVGMAFGSRVNLSAVGYFAVPKELCNFDSVTKKGRRWWYFTTGAACSLVEIDVLTGEHTLLSTNIVMDVGEAINPAIDIANIEAAFIQGYGWVAMEDTLYGPNGNLLSRGHDEYNLPTIADCPREFNVTLLNEKKSKHVLYSSKGIGEPPFFNGVSVYFAIKDAVLAARKAAGLTGKFRLELPTTPDNVRHACGQAPF